MNYTIPTGMHRIFIGIPVDRCSQKAINKLLKRLKTVFDQAINIELDMSSITLYQSTLTKSGSIYSVLTETRPS